MNGVETLREWLERVYKGFGCERVSVYYPDALPWINWTVEDVLNSGDWRLNEKVYKVEDLKKIYIRTIY